MHTADTAPRASVFYDYKIYPFHRPPEMDGGKTRHKVAIVGAGPVGMVLALDLARYGIPSVILEKDVQVSHGSRAIVLVRRSMEILQQVGVDKPFVDKGLTWHSGRSFYRGHEVYQMDMPHSPDSRFLPGLNIQQQFIEEYLVDACEDSDLIEMRWNTKFVSMTQTGDHATLTLDTPEGEYRLEADWVVAADGGRSEVRKFFGLRLEGQSFPGNFVIADILADIKLPTERLCYFDPEWNPGNNVLVHRQPDSLWRLDFRLPDGETAEHALDPAVLNPRIESILKMINQPVKWTLDWATVYSANTLTLPDFRHGRTLFVGDAAHLLPIFGVRGANTGFQDAHDMAWKLAYAIKGDGTERLLSSYSQDRVGAAREICAEGGRSTRFMTPPTRGYRVLRDAVLSLTLTEDFPKQLLHWRTSRPHFYAHSMLNSGDPLPVGKGIAPGDVLVNIKLGENDYLFDHLKPGFALIGAVRDAAEAQSMADAVKAAKARTPALMAIIAGPGDLAKKAGADLALPTEGNHLVAAYGLENGGLYLVRPDEHVAAFFAKPNPQTLGPALDRALGR